MQDDAQVAFGIALITPGFVNGRHIPFCIGNVNIAHRFGGVAADEDGSVLDLDSCPTLQGKTGVIGECRVMADKIGQRTLRRRAECLRSFCERGFEKNGTHIVAIGGFDHGLCGSARLFDPALSVIFGNLHQRIAPCNLSCFDLGLGNGGVDRCGRHGPSRRCGNGKKGGYGDRFCKRSHHHYSL